MSTRQHAHLGRIVIAGAALLLVSSGTGAAVGAALIDSGDIKNNAIRGADVRDGTLTSKDVKDGSLTSADLDDQAAGPAGPPGPPGPQGPAGPQGPRGEPGTLPGQTLGWSVRHPGGGTVNSQDGQLLATSTGTIAAATRTSTVSIVVSGDVSGCDDFFLVSILAVDGLGYAVEVGSLFVNGPNAVDDPSTTGQRGRVESLVGPGPLRLEARGWCYAEVGGRQTLLAVPAVDLALKLRVEALPGRVDGTL